MEPHPQMNITFLDVTGLSTEEIETLEDLLDPDNAKCQQAVELPWELECGRPVLLPSQETEGVSSPAEPCLAEPLLYTHMAAPPPYSPPEMQFYPPYLFGVPQFVSVKNPYWGGGGKGRNRKNKMAWDEEPPVMPYEMPPSFVPPFSYPQHLVYMPVSYPVMPMMPTDDASWTWAPAGPEMKKTPVTADFVPTTAEPATAE